MENDNLPESNINGAVQSDPLTNEPNFTVNQQAPVPAPAPPPVSPAPVIPQTLPPDIKSEVMLQEETEINKANSKINLHDNVFNFDKKKKIIRVVSIALFVLSLLANGYLVYSNNKINKTDKNQRAIIETKIGENKKQEASIKQLTDDLAVANAAIATTATAAATPSVATPTTTTKNSTSASTQESVTLPPSPPSD